MQRRRRHDMGAATSAVFAGRARFEANRILYAESARLFAEEIRKRLAARPQTYLLADVGTFRGELLGNLLAELGDFEFRTIGVDLDTDALQSNPVAHLLLLAAAESLPLRTGAVDVAIARYILQWNGPEAQKRILSELARAVRYFALLEHNGPGDLDAAPWRQAQERLFSGDAIAKLLRTDCYFATPGEIEQWLAGRKIPFQRIKCDRVAGLAEMYTERYGLDADEALSVRRILGPFDYVVHSDWVLYPGAG